MSHIYFGSVPLPHGPAGEGDRPRPLNGYTLSFARFDLQSRRAAKLRYFPVKSVS